MVFELDRCASTSGGARFGVEILPRSFLSFVDTEDPSVPVSDWVFWMCPGEELAVSRLLLTLFATCVLLGRLPDLGTKQSQLHRITLFLLGFGVFRQLNERLRTSLRHRL